MDIPVARRPFPAYIPASALSLGVVAIQMAMALNLLVDIKRVRGGMLGVVALWSIVGLGVAAIVILFGLPGIYAASAKRQALAARLLTVSAVQAFAFPLLRILHFVTVFFLRPGPWDYVLGGAGLVGGVVCTIYAVKSTAAARMRHQRAVEPGTPT